MSEGNGSMPAEKGQHSGYREQTEGENERGAEIIDDDDNKSPPPHAPSDDDDSKLNNTDAHRPEYVADQGPPLDNESPPPNMKSDDDNDKVLKKTSASLAATSSQGARPEYVADQDPPPGAVHCDGPASIGKKNVSSSLHPSTGPVHADAEDTASFDAPVYVSEGPISMDKKPEPEETQTQNEWGEEPPDTSLRAVVKTTTTAPLVRYFVSDAERTYYDNSNDPTVNTAQNAPVNRIQQYTGSSVTPLQAHGTTNNVSYTFNQDETSPRRSYTQRNKLFMCLLVIVSVGLIVGTTVGVLSKGNADTHQSQAPTPVPINEVCAQTAGVNFCVATTPKRCDGCASQCVMYKKQVGSIDILTEDVCNSCSPCTNNPGAYTFDCTNIELDTQTCEEQIGQRYLQR